MCQQKQANMDALIVCNSQFSVQRTPWGGGKKRGVENLTNDTPPRKGFWTPLHTVRFPPPSGVSALFFLYKNPRQSSPEAVFGGVQNFRESAFSGMFSSPHTFCTPPYHGPICLCSQKAHRAFLCFVLIHELVSEQCSSALSMFL